MSGIEKYKLSVIWSKPKERAEYHIFARSREDAEVVARMQFEESHTKDCEIVAIIGAGDVYGQ